MSLPSLSTQSLLDLTGLFEQSLQSVSGGDGQRLRGVPGWDISRTTSLSASQLSAWAECIGYAGHYPAIRDDETVVVELEEDDDPSRYRYRCPQTFRWKYVAAIEAAVYCVQSIKFLNLVADLLAIPQALRNGIGSPMLNGALWHLGKTRIGAAHTDVWLVRGLAQSVDDVFRHFGSQTLPDQGIILSSGMTLPDFIRPPRNYRFVSLRDVIAPNVPKPCLDMDLLHRILTTPADGALRPVLAVNFDEYTKKLTIRSKAKPWEIKGARQAAAIKYMFSQFQAGRYSLSAKEILVAAYPDKQSGKSQRMQNLFSGNTDWEDYIVNPEKGQYGFKLG
jgi:hypothetical protein